MSDVATALLQLIGRAEPAADPALAAVKLARASLDALILRLGQTIDAKVTAQLAGGLTQLTSGGETFVLKLETPLPVNTAVTLKITPTPTGQPAVTVTVPPQPQLPAAQPAPPAPLSTPPLPQPLAATPTPTAPVLPPTAQPVTTTPLPASPQPAAPTPSQPATPTPATPAAPPVATAAPPSAQPQPQVQPAFAATPAPAPSAPPIGTSPPQPTAIAQPIAQPGPVATTLAPTAPATAVQPLPQLPLPAGPAATTPPLPTLLATAPSSPPPPAPATALAQPAPTPAATPLSATANPTPPPSVPQPAVTSIPASVPAAPTPSAPASAASPPLGPIAQSTAPAAVAAPRPATPPPASPPLTQILADPVQAAARQDSVLPLITRLASLAAPTAAALPRPALEAIAMLLSTRLDLNRAPPDGKAIRDAVLRTGVVTEPGTRTPTDAKSALVQLRSALSGFLGGEVEAVAPVTRRPPPPLKGEPVRAPSTQHSQPLPDEPVETARQLLGHADAALSRTKLLQLASNPADAARPNITAAAEFRVEVPMQLGAETGILQLLVERDGKHKRTPAERGWRMRFALNFTATGEVGAEIALLGRAANVALWAADPATADALEAMLPELTPALARHGLDIGAVRVRRGAPQPAARAPGQLLDSAR